MRRVLMIAYHFPPLAGSSGIQRTLRFVQQLPDLGWEPVVLTAHPRAYAQTGTDLLAEVPSAVRVVRAFALDTARHFAFRGRYPGFLARPDRWQTWQFGAVASGIALLRRERFDAIWSTYPIATAHRIGAKLQRWSGLPWIADFRDPMAQDGYPADPKTWRSFDAIERVAVHRSARAVFATPGAAQMYRVRYPSLPEDRITVIENGYDEESFAAVEREGIPNAPPHPTRITLLHSGIVYPSERDPTKLIEALALLKAAGKITHENFGLCFRASVHEALLRNLAVAAGVSEMVQLLPPIPYRDALMEMLRADALVVMQAANCNEQVPAKLYEYLRARRPILAFTDPHGDTASVLRRSGISAIAPLDSAPAIAQLLSRFLERHRESREWTASDAAVAQSSRLARSAELAAVLKSVSGGGR